MQRPERPVNGFLANIGHVLSVTRRPKPLTLTDTSNTGQPIGNTPSFLPSFTFSLFQVRSFFGEDGTYRKSSLAELHECRCKFGLLIAWRDPASLEGSLNRLRAQVSGLQRNVSAHEGLGHVRVQLLIRSLSESSRIPFDLNGGHPSS